MTTQTMTPFELGRAHKIAGIPLGDKRCPYPAHSREWVRYQCGRQSINDAEAKKEREARRERTEDCHQ